MKNTILNLLLSVVAGLLFVINQSNACVRIDVEDRSQGEVAAKAISLGETLSPCSAVCAIYCRAPEGVSVATGVALDRYTVLTCAHDVNEALELTVIFDPSKTKGTKEIIKVSRVIPHSDFKANKAAPGHSISMDTSTKALSIAGVPLKDLAMMPLGGYERSNLWETPTFIGPDLAVLKLSEPLPESVVCPEIRPLEEKAYGVSIGCGPLKYNNQDIGPRKVSAEPEIKRHVTSVEVEPAIFREVPVLTGDYRGLFINGDESFIPDPAMKKTEGLPVAGDSGAPLLVSTDGTYVLSGIFSRTVMARGEVFDEPQFRELFTGYEQKLYPLWTDVSAYAEWVNSFMGMPERS